MDKNDLGEIVRQKVEEALGKRGRINVLIAGRSGVGKSTLVNAVFQGKIATTGQGRPVTKETREYTKEGVPISIFDTRGLEMAKFNETLRTLEDLVQSHSRDSDPSNHMHIGWVCISEESRRVEEGESKAIEVLAKHMPVVVVITKARMDQGFRADVQNLAPEARNVCRVRAIREEDEEGNVLQPRGLDDLVELTMELVPEANRDAFAAAQRVNLDQKKNRSHAVVASSATLAAAAGMTPIPFSDAVLLIPIQVGMLAGISAVFGLNLNKGFLTTLVGSAASALGATFAGRAIVSGLLKLIPGAGTIAGGAIAGATAATLTTTVGEIYLAVLAELFGESGGEPPPETQVAAAFATALKLRKATGPKRK